MRFVILLLLALVFNCSSQCRNALFIDWRAGTNLGIVTPEVLKNSTIGDTNKFGWVVASNPYNTLYTGAVTFATSAKYALSGPVSFCTGGSQDGSGSTLGLLSVVTTNAFQIPVACYLTNTGPILSIGSWIKWTIPNTNAVSAHDLFTIYGDTDQEQGGVPFSNFMLIPAPSGLTQSAQHEVTPLCAGGAQSSGIALPSTNWYWCALRYQMGTTIPNNALQIRDSNLTLVVELVCNVSCTTTQLPRWISYGIQNGGNIDTNQVVMYGSSIIDFDGTWPLLPIGPTAIRQGGIRGFRGL